MTKYFPSDPLGSTEVEHLPSTHWALGSVSSTRKNKATVFHFKINNGAILISTVLDRVKRGKPIQQFTGLINGHKYSESETKLECFGHASVYSLLMAFFSWRGQHLRSVNQRHFFIIICKNVS